MLTKRMTCRAYVKSVDLQNRIVEQIVSVFGNVDLGKDRVKAGAFAGTLDRWAASGDPIPTIWSHQWDNPEAHIGQVLEAKELLPGDALLPEEIADLGGLYTKYQLDDRPFAEQVLHLLNTRRVKEASFAYDVIREKKNSDGTNDLLELDLIEVGPTLKGMNQLTQLLSAKSLADASQVSFVGGVVAHLAANGGETLAGELTETAKTVAHAFAGGEEDPTRCVLCGLTRNTVAHNQNAAEPGGTKAYVILTGSMEEQQEAIYSAAFEWAQTEGIGNGGFYAAYLEATFPDRVVILVEGWDDPWGEGLYWELDYTRAADGTVTVDNPREVALETTTVAKARAMKHRARPGSIADAKTRATVPDEPHPGKGKGKAEDPTGKAEDPTTRTGTGDNDDGGDPAIALLELAELEMT